MLYMMHGATVVGYTYKTDNHCDDCMREVAKRETTAAGSATMWSDCGSAEDIVGEWAMMLGIDRHDETSYDDSEFPKVIFARAVHDGCTPDNGYERGQCGDRCVACHEPIGLECPNIAD